MPRVRVRVSVVAEMEELTEGVNNLAITEPQMKNKIQVSNTKKPLFFYVNLAKVSFSLSRFFLFDCLGGYYELDNSEAVDSHPFFTIFKKSFSELVRRSRMSFGH